MFPISDDVPSRKKPLVVFALILTSAVVFLSEAAMPLPILEAFARRWGLVPADVFTSHSLVDLWGLAPLITHMFVHGGWLHLIGNMWFLWVFGDNVEDSLGKPRFLVFYLGCGVAGALAQSAFGALAGDTTTPIVGASGAIAGVLGAYLVFFPYARILTVFFLFFWPFILELPATVYLGYWFVLQLLQSLWGMGTIEGAGVAWLAHVAGFGCGWLIARSVKGSKRGRPFRYTRVQ